MPNIKENQKVNKFGVLSLFVFTATLVGLFIPAWSGRSSRGQDQTLRRAESLAYQILDSQGIGRGRGPASDGGLSRLVAEEGLMGTDSWGQPFHFKLMKTNQLKRVLVWSLGPDGKAQTSEAEIESNRNRESPQFAGDDLGVMITIK